MLAVGQVHLWQGDSLWIGRGHGRSDWHDHHALQIALALDGVCMFRSQADEIWSEFKGAIVRSHRHHQFEVEGATMAQLFIEPETAPGRRCSNALSMTFRRCRKRRGLRWRSSLAMRFAPMPKPTR
jgi:hypothetical protein